jgi:hypothetical protein
MKKDKINKHYIIMDIKMIGGQIRCHPNKFTKASIFVNHIGKYLEIASRILNDFEKNIDIEKELLNEYEIRRNGVLNILK